MNLDAYSQGCNCGSAKRYSASWAKNPDAVHDELTAQIPEYLRLAKDD